MTDEIFHVLVLGDFSGTFSRNRPAPRLKPLVIDRDNFDEVLEAMRVSLEIEGKRIGFSELDDFDPDRLAEKLALLEEREETFTPPADLLGAILADQGDEEVEAEERPVTARDADDLSGFVERVTAGHLVPAKDPSQVKREADRFAMAGERLRAILHDPAFQALEAAWRALYLLIREVETGADLKIFVLDITLPELVVHADALCDGLKKMEPWAVIAGNFAFGQSEAEVRAIRKIAGLAKSLEAPFIAEAVPVESPSGAWSEFRKSPDAEWVGLAMPRFLLRLPYGKATSPIESFPFEEMPQSQHADYLWGNPAFLCVSLMAQAFESYGWDMEEIPRRVENLPLHIYRDDDGEALAKPCAEVLLTHSEAEHLMEAGVMPLASIKGQDAAILLRFQSVADPLKPLPGFHPA